MDKQGREHIVCHNEAGGGVVTWSAILAGISMTNSIDNDWWSFIMKMTSEMVPKTQSKKYHNYERLKVLALYQ